MPPTATSAKRIDAPRTRRRESRKLNLARIHAAAIEEFGLHGFRGATTDAIAQRAGMTRSQLHYYIAGKEELYEELLQSLLTQWAEDQFDHKSGDPEVVLRKYIADKVRHASEHPELARMFGLEMLSGAPNLDRFWPEANETTKAMVKTIDRWIREGRMRKVNAHLLLVNIWAMTSHHALFPVRFQAMAEASPLAKLDVQEIQREITDLVLAGCGLAPA